MKCSLLETGKTVVEIVEDTLNPYDFDTLKGTVMKDWHMIEEVRMMGSMKMLMIFDSKQNMEEALNSYFLLNHFLEVRIWTKHEANQTRRCWIEVTGLPIQGWTMENMTKIGETWGRVIRVEDDEGGHYNAFRVLLESNTGPNIQAFIDKMIQEEWREGDWKKKGRVDDMEVDGRTGILKEKKNAVEVEVAHTAEDATNEGGTERSWVDETQEPWKENEAREEDLTHVLNRSGADPNRARPSRTRTFEVIREIKMGCGPTDDNQGESRLVTEVVIREPETGR
ncbi:hypothetical protein PIB30_018574 [Stylosanthes scabra]|uniref:DUF4283 domain-containing protein n=1 Tax=Stylosanthes scabra TaxID=79078 RepID=A0ABU6R891_9FABA|nr:hypothetical protein [Stylosanthes scabra]